MPWRVYRPGVVVGDSETGQMDKIDGPYRFFKLIQKLRDVLPPWAPTIGVEGKQINLVPVNFVADAIDEISHQDGKDGMVFHLTDPNPLRAGQIINLFARSAHAPQMSMRLDPQMLEVIPPAVRGGLMMLPPVKRITDSVLDDLGIPARCWSTSTTRPSSTAPTPRGPSKAPTSRCRRSPPMRTSFGTTGSGTSIRTCSGPFARRNDRRQSRDDHRCFFRHREAAAMKAAAAGAKVLLVARSRDKLEEIQTLIAEEGGGPSSTADLSDTDDIEADGRRGAGRARSRRCSGQQRRPLDPPFGRAFLRSFPRLRGGPYSSATSAR